MIFKTGNKENTFSEEENNILLLRHRRGPPRCFKHGYIIHHSGVA